MKKLISLLFLLTLTSCTIKVENPDGVVYIDSTPKVSVQTPTLTAPDAPTSLTTISDNTQITVSWQPVLNATSYNLYWSNLSGTTKLNGTQVLNVTLPYIHTSLTNGTKYYYVITSVGNNLESNESTEISVFAGIVDNHDGSVFVAHLNQTWQKCSDNYYNPITDSCDIAGMPFHIYCATQDYSCTNMVVLTSGDVFNTCATLSINGGGWRVPTAIELITFQPYHKSTGVVEDWHWASDAVPFQMRSMWDGSQRQPIWRYDVGYVICVK